MAISPGEFCTTASEAYKKLDASSKQSLVQQAEELASKEVLMTPRDARKHGARVFKKIKSQVCTCIVAILAFFHCFWMLRGSV